MLQHPASRLSPGQQSHTLDETSATGCPGMIRDEVTMQDHVTVNDDHVIAARRGNRTIAGTGQAKSFIGLPHVQERRSQPLLPARHHRFGVGTGPIVSDDDFRWRQRLPRRALQSQIEAGGQPAAGQL